MCGAFRANWQGSWERWQKNLKTKIKAGGGGRGVWGRVRDGEGWAYSLKRRLP